MQTVTIGIIAYNEEQNIKQMLKSVLSQDFSSFHLDKILVISDGSTDKTVLEVESLKSNVITIHAFNKRIGKSSHLNTIFTKSNSDIVVLFDADIILKDKETVSNLIHPLITLPNVAFVGGNPLPIPGKTFIEKAVNVSCYPYIQIRKELQNTPYGCDGRVLALKKEFYKKLHVPETMIANDNFMYFTCITKGFDYVYVEDAKVYYRSPTTFNDQIRQNKRFIAARQRLTRIFGKIAEEKYAIPASLKIKYLLLQLIKHPVLSVSIFIINKYCTLRAIFEEKVMTAKWAIAETTKEEIKVK